MAFKTNIKEFSGKVASHLVDSYKLLVVIELALKDGNYGSGQGGHDVPAMLVSVGQAVSSTTAEINLLSTSLGNALFAVTCQDIAGNVTNVPRHSYPYLRYSRMRGDWAGLNETPSQNFADLYALCEQTYWYLRTHQKAIGINL